MLREVTKKMNNARVILVAVFGTIMILSCIWGMVFSVSLKKNRKRYGEKKLKKKAFLAKLKPISCWRNVMPVCAILLVNSDEEISKAIYHIKPSRHVNNLLERLYEQRRI